MRSEKRQGPLTTVKVAKEGSEHFVRTRIGGRGQVVGGKIGLGGTNKIRSGGPTN